MLVFIGLCIYTNNLVQYVSGDEDLGALDSYKISWKGPPSLEDKKYVDKYDENVIHISTKDNEKYVCIVPSANNLNFDTSATNSSSDATDNKNKSPVRFLEPLFRGNICSYKFEVFWIYELCHGRYLRQYHEESAKYKARVTQEYFLGKMEQDQIQAHEDEYYRQREEQIRNGEPRPTILVNGQYKPYLTFNMTSGTKCDLTKKSRISRIIYVCNEDNNLELYSIKEISTCEYEAIVLSHMLCQHEDFKTDANTQHEIKCYSLDGSPLRPKKTLEYEDNNEADSSATKRGAQKRVSRAYLQGRTLIIDMDSIL